MTMDGALAIGRHISHSGDEPPIRQMTAAGSEILSKMDYHHSKIDTILVQWCVHDVIPLQIATVSVRIGPNRSDGSRLGEREKNGP